MIAQDERSRCPTCGEPDAAHCVLCDWRVCDSCDEVRDPAGYSFSPTRRR